MNENKKIINYDKLTAIIFAAAQENKVPVSDGASMVNANIRDGRETYPLRGSLPMDFKYMIPNWATMGGHDALVDSNGAFNAWLRKMKANYAELTGYWREHKCNHMCTLMEQSQDPGPVSGPAREEWEKEQEEAQEGESGEGAADE